MPMSAVPADHLPRPRRQLDGSRYAGGACGDISTRNGLDWSTGGKVRASAEDIRTAMASWVGQDATPPTDATSLLDQQRAWETFRDDARHKGLRLGSYTRRLVDPWPEVADAIDAGYAVALQYSYAVINDRAPSLSGSPTFRGLHIALIPKLRRRNGGVEYLVYDGLYDGRRPGIPKGPQWVPGWVLRVAAEEKVRLALIADGVPKDKARAQADGNAVFAVIGRSTTIVKPPKPEPEPGPEPTCAELLAACREALINAEEERDMATALIDELEARDRAMTLALGTARTILLTTGQALSGAVADIDDLLPDATDDGTEPSDGVGAEKR